MENSLQAVEIEINHACNRTCHYCPNSELERKTKGVMSFELFQLVLDNLVEINFKGRISYDFYNEPLLHPQLERFVKETKLRLPQSPIHLYSNGTLLTEKKVHSLLDCGIDKFIITRHIQDETSEKYLFDQVFQTLSDDQKKKFNYRSHHDLQLVNRGGILKHLGENGLPLHPCHLPSHLLTITVDGRILSCFEDYNENLVFGDLKTEKLIDIWNRESYVLFRRSLKLGMRHLFEPCKNCNRKEVLPPFNI